MSFVRQAIKSVTISTGSTSDSATMSTHLNGEVSSVYIAVTAAMGAGEQIILTAATSTQKGIITVANPSTLGAYYYPRASARGITSGVLASSHPATISLCNEQVGISVQSSSATGGTATIVVSVV